MQNVLPGKKTYFLIALAAIAALANYAQTVVAHGFNFSELISFINTEAVTAAMATLRLAIGKK